MKIYLISFLIILYAIIYLTLTIPYVMIPVDCIIIYFIYKNNPLCVDNINKDKRDICRF